MDPFALLDRLDGGGDAVLSPYSVRRALDLVRGGARGHTRAALDDVLGPDATPALSADGLALAQAAWLGVGYAPGPALNGFHAGPLEVDAINAWASEKTNGMIPSVIDRLDPTEQLAITDAIYLDAKWRLPFERAGKRPFDGAGDVEMMEVEGVFEHAEGAIRLPYGEGELRFVARLDDAPEPPRLDGPREPTPHDDPHQSPPHIDAPESPPRVTERDWRAVEWSRGYGTVVLPAFGAESRHDLAPALVELGLDPAFVPSDELEDLFIGPGLKSLGRILQRARVDVDDEGTRAAAVTAVTARAISAVAGPTFHLIFDRPFTWAIEHAPTGTLLFVGRVRRPRERSH
jgi:serpin B